VRRAAWTTETGRYWQSGASAPARGVRDRGEQIDDAGQRTAGPRRGGECGATRMWSAATSGAGGHDAPPGQLATSSAWTSAALERPLTTVSAVTSRSPMVESGRSARPGAGERGSSAPVSISRVDSWRWCRKVGGSPRRPRCSCTNLGSGTRAGEEAGIEFGSAPERSAPPTMTPETPDSTAAPRRVERVQPRPVRVARARWGGSPTGRPPKEPAILHLRAPARCRAT